MSQSRKLLDLAREIAAGRAALPDLRAPLDAVAGATSQARATFTRDSADNPEISPQSRALVLEAMAAFEAALSDMRAAIERGDASALAPLVEAADGHLEAIRQAQASYETQISRGGATAFPFANRLLIHVQALERDDADTSHTLALLDQMPPWLDELERQVRDVGGLGLASQGAVAVGEMRLAADALRQALAGDGDRALAAREMRQAVLRGAERLQRVLGKKVEDDLEDGPTPVAVINLVLRAADALARGAIGPEALHEIVGRARAAVASMAAGQTEEAVVEAVDVTDEALQAVDAAPSAATLEALNAAAQNLAMFLVVTSHPSYDVDEDEEAHVDFVTGAAGTTSGGGLPRLLSTLLQVGEMYVEGRASQRDVLDGVDQLDALVARTADVNARGRDNPERMNLTQQCLDLLCEAGDCMRTVAATRDAYALRNAESLMRTAHEHLQAAQQIR